MISKSQEIEEVCGDENDIFGGVPLVHADSIFSEEPPLLMTPGPTYISEEVRVSMSKKIVHHSVDMRFFNFYQDLTKKIQRILKTKNDVVVLAGEGILTLEAACSSLIEPGDTVLVISNGVFGAGFKTFAEMFGAEILFFEGNEEYPLDFDDILRFLEKHNDANIKMATMVHCETPSGILNDISKLVPMLKKRGILTVVDAISSIGGIPIETDEWGVDLMLGAGQKVLSGPGSLSFLSISDDAWSAMEQRKVPVPSFYSNLYLWKDWFQKKKFPYSQPISAIYGLDAAVNILLRDKENIIERHKRIGEATRNALRGSGLEFCGKKGYSNTVTCVIFPDGITWDVLGAGMLDHGVALAPSFGRWGGKAFRIGHMGENCREDKVYITLKVLDKVLRENGVKLPKKKIHEMFVSSLE